MALAPAAGCRRNTRSGDTAGCSPDALPPGELLHAVYWSGTTDLQQQQAEPQQSTMQHPLCHVRHLSSDHSTVCASKAHRHKVRFTMLLSAATSWPAELRQLTLTGQRCS